MGTRTCPPSRPHPTVTLALAAASFASFAAACGSAAGPDGSAPPPVAAVLRVTAGGDLADTALALAAGPLTVEVRATGGAPAVADVSASGVVTGRAVARTRGPWSASAPCRTPRS